MIKTYDNVLTQNELKSFASDMHAYAGYIMCPHTDNALKSKFIKNSLNDLRPRSKCLLGSNIIDNLVDIGHAGNFNDAAISTTLEERGVEMDNPTSFGQWLTKQYFPASLQKIISKAPVDHKGVEWWSYDSENLGRGAKTIAVPKHIDFDGGLEMLTGEIVCPEITYIFYDKVDKDIKGGELVVYDTDSKTVLETIKPKENRLVVFSGGSLHEVLEFTGYRRSFVLLPWKNRPREFL